MPALPVLFRRLALTLALPLLCACNGGSGGTGTIEGSVTGLTGTLVLQVNDANTTTLTANGNYSISTSIATGASYAVTVVDQPSGQTCTISNGSGTVGSSAVTGVDVVCASNHLAVVASAGSLNVFELDSTTGQLTALGSTSGFTNIAAIGFDPAAAELYVVDTGANLFSLYAVGAGGALTVSSAVTPGAGNALAAAAIDPVGAIAYLAYTNSGSGDSYIQAYSISSTGALNAFGSPQLLSGAGAPLQVLVDPNNTTLLVLAPHAVTSYVLNAGVLSLAASYALVDATLMAVDPGGDYFYVVDNTGGAATANQSLISLSIGTGGALSAIGNTASTGAAPTSLTVSQSGNTAVLTEAGGFLDTSIASGSMSVVSTTTTADGVPIGFAVDSTGTFGYAIFQGNPQLAVYRLTGGVPNPDISNQLTAITLPTGDVPTAIAIR